MYRLFLIAWCIPCCLSACTFPSDLVGDWYSTTFGTLTFTADSFTGVTAPLSVNPLTFSCYELDGTRYIVKTSTSIFAGLSLDIFLCMNLVQISPVKYYYTLDSNFFTEFGLRMFTRVSDSATVAAATVCNQTDTRHAGEYELLILKANISDAVISCPDGLRSQLNVTEMATSTTSCNDSDTFLDGQMDTKLAFNYSTCAADIAFNAGATLWCMHYTSDSNIYLTTFNNDSTTDESTKFRFTCFTFSKYGTSLTATEYPRVCQANQTATFVEAPGLAYIMTDTLYSEEEDDGVNVGLIVGMVILGLLILILIILLLVYLLICRKKPKKKTQKNKLSIHEYRSNGSLTVRNIDKKVKDPNKVSGLVKGGRLSKQVSHCKPAKKEKWQDKWEKKMRPRKSIQQTPIVSETSEEPVYSKTTRRNKAPSSLPLDKTTTMTASLPSNLDASETNGTAGGTLNGKSAYLRRSLPDPPAIAEANGDVTNPRLPRFSQDAFATTRMPESTGKFGGTKRSKSSDNIILPVRTPRLQTIDESALSREGSSVARSTEKEIKPLAFKRVPSFIDTTPHTDVLPQLTDVVRASRSTLSTRAVMLDDPNGTVRPLSRMTGSNTSIFDDPSWLETNANIEPEKVFARKANLLPGIPPKENNWFTKGNRSVLSAISRSDIEYNPNNRTNTLIGINSKGLTKIRKQIEEKKKKRKREWMLKWEIKQRPKSRKFSFARRRYRISPSPTYTFDSYVETLSPQQPGTNITNLEKKEDFIGDTIGTLRDTCIDDTIRTKKRDAEEGTAVREDVNGNTNEQVPDHITEVAITEKTKSDGSNSNRKQNNVSQVNPIDIAFGNAETRKQMTGFPHNIEKTNSLETVNDTNNKQSLSLENNQQENENADNCDTISTYSEIFYPDEWLYDDEEEAVERCWSAGCRWIPATPRNDSKLWCSTEAEREVTERQFTQEMYHIMQYPVRKKSRYGRWRKEEEVEYHVMRFKDDEKKTHMYK